MSPRPEIAFTVDPHGRTRGRPVQVAGRVVGGPGIELPVGRYRVEVPTDPILEFDAVEVIPGEAARLVVEAAPDR